MSRSRRNFNSNALRFVSVLLVGSGIAFSSMSGCKDEHRFANVFVITDMAQTIGGPAAAGRPGDFLLENDRIRAIVHGRHNERSTNPNSNGSLMDLDLQRPYERYGGGKGADAFFELGPMVNLKVSTATEIKHGACNAVGSSPCPQSDDYVDGECKRVATRGTSDIILGILGLLDLAVQRNYPDKNLEILTDYDLCPGEPFVRVTTTARFYGKGEALEMPELAKTVGLIDPTVGEHAGIDCANATPCPESAPHCDDLLVNLDFGSIKTEMKRCRSGDHKLAAVSGGDFLFLSGKVDIFIPGNGFDKDTSIHTIFDSGGDVFSNPLALDFTASVGDDVSYAYFNETGKAMIPIFSSSFSASLTNIFACPRKDPDCFKGKELRFRRFISVGKGDAASALEPYYTVRNIPVGKLRGHVIDQRSRKPISKLDLFAFTLPKSWESFSDEAIMKQNYTALIEAHRNETRRETDPFGQAGIVSHFRSDPSLDNVFDGSFGGSLPVGRYILVAKNSERPISALTPVRMDRDRTTNITVIASGSGTLRYQITDEGGRPIPSKLTFGHCFAECARDQDCSGNTPRCDRSTQLCIPKDGYRGPGDCRPDQTWNAQRATCVCQTVGEFPLELGGGRFSDGTKRTVISETGTGTVKMPPGTYQVIASRGFEYEIHKQFVTLLSGTDTRLSAALPHVIDRQGWISGDFHVHGPNSVDSGLDADTRIKSYVAEGVDYLVATDHEYLTDYRPTILRLGLDPWVKSEIGVEVSPLDYGHFIGFPMRYNENADLNGSFHWRLNEPSGGRDWRNMTPGEIFTTLREHSSASPDESVVIAAHFYDYFGFYSVDPWTLDLPPFSITSFFNSVLLPQNFSGEFDVLELFNGKRFDVLRRPTIAEVNHYNRELTKILSNSTQTLDEKRHQWRILSMASQREFVRRTADEQTFAIDYRDGTYQCRCSADAECGLGYLCDEYTGACIAGCAQDADCDDTLTAAKREACVPFSTGDSDRRTCQRVTESCQNDEDCDVTWGKASAPIAEQCLDVSGTLSDGTLATRTCQIACETDSDCNNIDKRRPICHPTTKHCVAKTSAIPQSVEPCRTAKGTIDDWFQMLNRGFNRPVVGSSDSHSTYGVEAGLPRTYLQSDAQQPGSIETSKIVHALKEHKTFLTYGPFVEFWIDDNPIGSTVSVEEGQNVKLRIKVQSPRWFDVDRVEVYKNGALIHEMEGRTDCDDVSECIRVPNNSIVNFDGVITDTAERDAWYSVIALGLDGKSMAPVYSTDLVGGIGIFEIVQRLTPILPPLRSLRTPLSPTSSNVLPYAITSPIWVDVGGDGITPIAEKPYWATLADLQKGKTSSALTQTHSHEHSHDGVSHSHSDDEANHDHDDQTSSLSSNSTPSTPINPKSPLKKPHDHRSGLGRMRIEANEFINMAKEGALTEEMLQQAFDALRSLAGH